MMAILQSQDANILDAEAVNWRRVVYPVVGLIVLLLGGLGIYYYQLSQRDALEVQARQAVVKAITPEALVQVADQFPKTTQADFALISAADFSIARKDYTSAATDYQRVIDGAATDAVLRDSARVGLASVQEMQDKLEDAIQSYVTVGDRGHNSPYAPFAYSSAARLYAQKKDTANERKMLSAAIDLGGDSAFAKQADDQLKALDGTQAAAAAVQNAITPSSSAPPPAPPPEK
jgi:predicted negative regulator of RcsB-dependent stress response